MSDDELQRLLEEDVDLPHLSDTPLTPGLAQILPRQVHTVFDAIAESRGDQVHDRVHEANEPHF